MGTPEFSVPTLDALVAAGHEIAAVYAQPPRPAGRGKRPRLTPVHARAKELGLEVRTPVRLGLSERRQVEILEGVDVGDRIIISDIAAFVALDEIRIRP